MARFRSSTTLAAVGVAVSLSACGGVASFAPTPVVTWYPSTPLPSPRQALASPSVAAATATAPPGVGQGQSSGLGTPVANISATDSLTFDPTTATVKTGAVVQWKDTGSTAHNVTFDGQPALTSGTLQQGNTWQVQFTTAGTYQYHCTFHPGMNGQITVSG